MDFDLTEEQQLLKSTVREYVEKEIAPQVNDYERKGPLTREEAIAFIKQLMPFGFYNGRLDEDWGGSNLDRKTYGIINEELSRVWPGLCGMIWIAGAPPAVHSDAERSEYRARMRAGESIACGGISEPEVGSGASYLRTHAVADGDHWVVTGTKTWISCGPIADHIDLMVTIDPGAGRDSVRRLHVRKDTSPWEVVRHNNLLGLRAWPNGELRFDGVRVPRVNMRAMRDESDQATAARVWDFQQPRTLLAVMAVGIAQAAIDASIRYVRERHQFGRPIGSFQLVQEMLYEMVVETDSARFLAYRAMDLQDKGRDSTAEAAMAKGFATEMAVRVTSKAIELHGALGLMEDYPIERYFRDARSLTIPDGTTEIQKLVVGRRLTGISAIV
ncbi:MAG: acyl-CoA dehydrogenase family protein [Thermoflexaceae bacterium]|nr:acyl-CoA dehydrogenase family protein [Thermoflexaceae bacterium]